MIWLLFGVMVLAVLAFALAPLYKKTLPALPVSDETADYLEQIADVDRQLSGGSADETGLEAKKTELQRRLLASSGHDVRTDSGPPAIMLAVLIVGFGFGAMGLYAMLGRPELTDLQAAQKPVLSAPSALSMNGEPQHENNASLFDLVLQLEAKLEQDGSNQEGWMLYARSLMTLGRFDEAFTAYDRVLALTGNNPNVAEELARAQEFANQQGASSPLPPRTSGPSVDDVAAAAAMSEGDRAAMIEGMVEGLAAKLEGNPENPEGWARLLRARKVLGQLGKAQQDMDRMKAVYADRPDMAKEILVNAGWPED